MSTLALIGLGSNLGDRRAHLDAAIAALEETPGIEVRAVSSYHETTPVGGPREQGAFLNAAAAIETRLEPAALLCRLQAIEAQEGRTRSAHWAERTLDLDVLLYGSHVIPTRARHGTAGMTLQVPHPWLPFRRFVLAPLIEIAPDAVDPLTGRTVAGLVANLNRRPKYIALSSALGRLRGELGDRIITQGAAQGVRIARIADVRPRLRKPPESAATEVKRADRIRIPAEFGQLRRNLSLKRWTRLHPAERWIITDLWFDNLIGARGHSGSKWPPFWERFLKVRSEIIPPTFVVTLSGNRVALSRSSSLFNWLPPLGDVPVLEVDHGDPEAAAAKVLIACAAADAL